MIQFPQAPYGAGGQEQGLPRALSTQPLLLQKGKRAPSICPFLLDDYKGSL